MKRCWCCCCRSNSCLCLLLPPHPARSAARLRSLLAAGKASVAAIVVLACSFSFLVAMIRLRPSSGRCGRSDVLRIMDSQFRQQRRHPLVRSTLFLWGGRFTQVPINGAHWPAL